MSGNPSEARTACDRKGINRAPVRVPRSTRAGFRRLLRRDSFAVGCDLTLIFVAGLGAGAGVAVGAGAGWASTASGASGCVGGASAWAGGACAAASEGPKTMRAIARLIRRVCFKGNTAAVSR